MTWQERHEVSEAYLLARGERIKAERKAQEWLCEEQRLAHKLWREDHLDDGA